MYHFLEIFMSKFSICYALFWTSLVVSSDENAGFVLLLWHSSADESMTLPEKNLQRAFDDPH